MKPVDSARHFSPVVNYMSEYRSFYGYPNPVIFVMRNIIIYSVPLLRLGKDTPSTAALSVNQVTLSCAKSLMIPHGREWPSSVSKICFRISFLPPPVATNPILMPWLATGRLRVMRFGGGFGLSKMGRTQASASRSKGDPGNNEQV